MSVKIACLWGDIWTRDLSNSKQEHKLLDHNVWCENVLKIQISNSCKSVIVKSKIVCLSIVTPIPCANLINPGHYLFRRIEIAAWNIYLTVYDTYAWYAWSRC
jgi:hypothetical protein